MRKITRSILATAAVVGLLAIPVAATAGDNVVTFTVAANTNGLSISHATTAVNLTSGGNAIFSLTDQSKGGTLPQTTVTDQRGLLQTWTVGVKTNGDWISGGNSVPASNGRVYLDATDAAGLTTTLGTALTGMTITGGEFNAPTKTLSTTAYTLLTGTTASLTTASITYTPAISVTIPGGTAPGTYTATVTQTAS